MLNASIKAILYTKTIIFRRYLELDILESTLLPSDVIRIKFYRPPNFKFLSGKKQKYKDRN